MDQLLVDGYIRSFQKIVIQIIPYPINQLCLQFYFVSKRMIAWSRKFNNLYITDFDIDITNNYNQIKVHQNCKCSVYSMEGTDVTTSDSWQVYEPGICYNSNVKFSNLMSQKINATFNKLNTSLNSTNHYDTVFKCGGGALDYCHAMLIHPQQFYDIKENDVMAINLALPSLPERMQTNALIFCEYYGCLISIGGEISSTTKAISSIYRLSFDESMDNKNEWKWMELNEMSQGRVAPSAVMIDDHRFIVIGGYNEYATDSYSNIVEMYDLETNGWSILAPMNIGRSDTTSCFNKNLNKIYVVGSDGIDSNIVEEYDINKNVWSKDNIPKTICDHGDCLTFWMEDINILAITSSSQNVMEIIDLREDNKSWKLIDDKNLLQTLYGNDFPKKDISTWIVMN